MHYCDITIHVMSCHLMSTSNENRQRGDPSLAPRRSRSRNYESSSSLLLVDPVAPPPPPSSSSSSTDTSITTVSPDIVALHGGGSLIASSAIRHVRRVSKQAALATKKQIWDSNDASIVAAQSAVDQWEQGYNAMRHLLCAIGDSAQGLYGAAKAGVSGLEHGLLLPVRDWVLLPAFGGVEKIAGETIGFLQSEQAKQLAHQSLDVARQIPFVGDNILAPALCIGAEVLRKSWEVAQYPIPSPLQVKDSVNFVMTGTKWALTTAGREVHLYVKRADANITRTLSHTRWKVLGSGPYATLDKLNKGEVIDHLCERYFSLVDSVARYELAAHIRAHNRPLYHDLVLTGLLRERGGELTNADEWLSSCPNYRDLESPFLLDEEGSSEVSALWFRLPYYNGKRPRRDTPWVMFEESERRKLERHYRNVVRKNEKKTTSSTGKEDLEYERDHDHDYTLPDNPNVMLQERYPTSAKWYNHDPENDLLLDQKRHAVSFFPCCPKCRRRHDLMLQVPCTPKQFGELCDTCVRRNGDAPWVDTLLSSPPVIAVYRPTMWRFYGPGDELRRATWFLDTQRHGLQPYGEDAQAVLEDAYLFLKWTTRRRVWDGSILLTVQVPSPDGGEQQLVQFSSLTSATAIGKGLGSAIALFKRRVYRGAYHARNPVEDPDNDPSVLDGSEESTDDLSYIEEESTSHNFSDTSTGEDESESSNQWVEMDPNAPPAEDFGNSLEPPRTATPMKQKVIKGDADTTENIDPMKIYTDEVKSLRLRLARPLDEHLQLAYPMKKEEEEAPKRYGIDTDDNRSDDVDHLILIVHGIGEMLQAIDFFGLSKLPTIVDCCGFLRKNHSEVLEIRFNQLYKKLDGIRLHRMGPGRVEYLPIEWHDSFTIQSQRRLLSPDSPRGPTARNYTIDDVSLRTIPQLRQFANDTLMDVLYFMSPEHHDIIVDIVVNEMNFVVDRFRKLTGFKGDISLVGHSLGSIITWDILDNQRGFRASLQQSGRISFRDQSSVASSTPSSTNEENSENTLSVRPEEELPEANNDVERQESARLVECDESTDSSFDSSCQIASLDYPQLDFKVENAFMLGSPIAVFLMIRDQRKPLSTDFKLEGCSQVFNIFHPYDPVAYRIEPLLDSRNAEIEPKIMTHWHGGFRFQYQTKLFWKKLVAETVKTQENVVASLESGIAALGLLDGTAQDMEEDEEDDDDFDNPVEPHTVVTGSLNRGQRIDYMLQEKELESANEYVAALAAHSCYWLEKDLSLFIARQICLRALEREDGEAISFQRPSLF